MDLQVPKNLKKKNTNSVSCRKCVRKNKENSYLPKEKKNNVDIFKNLNKNNINIRLVAKNKKITNDR